MDGTEERKDTSQGGDSPSTPKGTSTEPKTYSEESEKKAVSDALSAAGRDAKTISDKAGEAERILTDAKKTRDAVLEEQEQWQKERDEAARESLRGDPEALKSHEERIRQRNEAAKLAERKRELGESETRHKESVASDLEQVRVFNRTQLAAEVAVAKGVSLDSILKLTKEDSREAMEATADLLPKTGEPKPSLRIDSSTTIGGGANWEEVRAAYIKNPSNPAVFKRYMEMRKERDAQK